MEEQEGKLGEKAAIEETTAGQSFGSKIGAQVTSMWQKAGSWFKSTPKPEVKELTQQDKFRKS